MPRIGTGVTVLLIAAALSSFAAAQVFGPAGPEFRVNTYTTGNRYVPSIAADDAGGFLVTWVSRNDLPDSSIFAQRFGIGATPVGVEFRVNTTTTGSHPRARAAKGASGQIVVVWDARDASSDYDVLGRRIATGPEGPEFRVNTFTSFVQWDSVIASDAAGNFVVVWGSSDAASSYPWSVLARRYSSSGALLGNRKTIQVNTQTLGNLWSNAVACDGGGAFVVFWAGGSNQVGAGLYLFGQRFSNTGARLGDEFLVNGTTPLVLSTSAAMDPAGGFTVVWSNFYAYDNHSDILGRRYLPSGAPADSVFRVNTYRGGNLVPSIASDQSGNFVVVWNQIVAGNQGDPEYDLHGRRFDSSGRSVGDEFLVNAYTSGSQRNARVAFTKGGDFVVTWDGSAPDGGLSGIYARTFCMDLAGDANGDGVINVADILSLINSLFAGGPGPVRNCDVNGDASVTVGDILYLINYLFAGGPTPRCATGAP